jgi:uncharacterized membrane protein
VIQEKRHIAKTISYRILSSSIGFGLLYLATGSISVGATFSTAELLFKPFIYYLHERVWYKWIKFGIKK